MVKSQAYLVGGSVLNVIGEWVDPCTKSDPLANNVLCGWVITVASQPHKAYSNLQCDCSPTSVSFLLRVTS